MEPRRVNLRPGDGSTVRFFLMDHDGEAYRVSWRQQRRATCPDCQGEGTAAVGLCKGCGGKGWYKPMVRTTGRHEELHWAIAIARGEVKPRRGRDGEPQGEPSLDSVLLADYVWSTEWGATLPGAKHWQAMQARWVGLSEMEAKRERAVRDLGLST